MRKTDTKTGRKPVIVPLNLNAVNRIVISHLDEGIHTPYAIDPYQLARDPLAESFTIVASEKIRGAYQALRASEPYPDPALHCHPSWRIVFFGRDDESLLEAYTDRFGVQGEIAGKTVGFSHAAFLRWLEGEV